MRGKELRSVTLRYNVSVLPVVFFLHFYPHQEHVMLIENATVNLSSSTYKCKSN